MEITLGVGKKNTVGRILRVENIEELAVRLEAHDRSEAWWSPHVWDGNRRGQGMWQRAQIVAVDVDCKGEDGKKADIDEFLRGQVTDLSMAGELPGTAWHFTPHGMRLLWLYDRPLSRGEYLSAAEHAEVETAHALRDFPSLQIDTNCTRDLARFFWAPRARGIESTARDGSVLVHGASCPADDLRAVETETRRTAHAPIRIVDAADVPALDFSTRTCPICAHRDCWGPAPGDNGKGWCFSTSHESGGLRLSNGWLVSPLDVLSPEDRRSALRSRNSAPAGTSGALTPAVDTETSVGDPDDPGPWDLEHPAAAAAQRVVSPGLRGTLDAVRSVMPRLRHNLMTDTYEAHSDAGVRTLQEHDAFAVNIALERAEIKRPAGPGKVQTLRLRKQDAWDHLVQIAREDPYEPLRDYVDGCAADPDALAELPIRIGLAPDDTEGQALVILTVLAMAARAREPGCKVDTMLVLVGSQGARKSSAISAPTSPSSRHGSRRRRSYPGWGERTSRASSASSLGGSRAPGAHTAGRTRPSCAAQ
jgi:hypothetical protein